MIIHEFYAPSETRPEMWLEIAELTHLQCKQIAESAARQKPSNILACQAHVESMRMLQCVRGFRRYTYHDDGGTERQECTLDMHTTKGDGNGPHDIMAAMTEREAGFLGLAVDRVHEVRQEETAAFFGSQKTTEV